MKSLVVAAAASLAAGVLAAQSVSLDCCTQVFDFKATIKNSNVKQVLDKSCESVCDVKFVENNTLTGWLVLFCGNSCCEQRSASGWLYVYRNSDKRKLLYTVPVGVVIADRFVKGLDSKNDCIPLLGTDAEGALIINTDVPEYGWNDTLAGFFNGDEGSYFEYMDSGWTVFAATGFGKVVVTKDTTELVDTDDDPCTPPEKITIPGCAYLDSLSGSIVGLMQYDYLCQSPFEVLCLSKFLDIDGYFNAVATGTWSIRRNTKLDACVDSEEAFLEQILVGKMKDFTVIDNAD